MRDPVDRYFYGEPQALIRALQEIVDAQPEARLVKNQIGNLTILSREGEYIGWLDIHEAEVGWL
jgi:hypothetical protein